MKPKTIIIRIRFSKGKGICSIETEKMVGITPLELIGVLEIAKQQVLNKGKETK